MPAHTRTVCLEFFGNAKDAVPSIVEIKDFMFAEQKRVGGVLLAGLEHLDDRYLKAVGYATKSKRGGLPKMVLFGDIVGDDADAVARATSEVVRIANARGGEGFVAVSAEARKKFWLDRKRTAAISKHTNAFKINEDVVIPLPRMGEYTDGIERINIELQPAQQARAGRRAGGLLRARQPAAGQERRRRRDRRRAELLEDRVQQALALLREVRALWRRWLADLDVAAAEQPARSVFALLQDHTPARLVEDADPRAAAERSSPARRFAPILDECQRIHQRGAARAASGSRCTCTPATATCTPTSRSTATTTRCCRPRTRRWRASWRWRARSTA